MIKRWKGTIPLALLVALINPSGASAQILAANSAGPTEDLEAVIVTGTRQTGIKAVDSAAPIQIVSAADLKASGSPDLMSALAQVVPSLQMQAFGFDMSGQTLQARLRGVSPNDVLVLINGKRRHTTANLAIDTGSPFQGGAGVDLNFIPLDAIDHVEVLTEGAAAQYGSDAIAGVINIILKRNSSGGSLAGTYGQYGNDGGGKTEDVSGNVGFEPQSGAYFNLTGDFRNHGHSNVGEVDPRLLPQNLGANAPAPIDNNVTAVPGYPYLNAISGDAAVQQKIISLNAGWDFDGGTEVYFIGTYGHKDAVSYENYRVPHKNCYSAEYNLPVNQANPNEPSCANFPDAVLPEPNGFNPQEANYEDDYQLTGGIKGTFGSWDWDLTTGIGGDHDNLYTLSTVNTGYFGDTGLEGGLSDIYDGYLQATQWASTADFRSNFDVGFAAPLNVAFGFEHRRDTYSIGAGPPISYIDGGASSYPGFTPLDAGSNARTNDAGYVDFATKPIAALQIDAAARFEHYSDFGNATVGKLTGRYDFSPEFAVRGTINNGFRAPTLAEEYYSSTNVGPSTAYVQLPPNSAAGKLLGLGNGLQPEKSVDFSVGLVWRPLEHMSTTLDLYQITITNRIVGSGNVQGQVNGVPTAAYAGVNAAIAAYSHGSDVIDPYVLSNGSYGINVFANGIDTRTDGADLVFLFPYEYSFGKIDWTVSAAYNNTSITKYATTPAALSGATLYDVEAYSELTTATPRYVLNLGADVILDKLNVNLVEKIYGQSSDWENDDGDNPTNANEYFKDTIGVTAITNLDIGFQFTDSLKLSFGAQNLFNRFPNKLNSNILGHEIAAADNAAVTQYPIFSPFGINGGFYYVKAVYKF
ncbi:MAG: TonB-dependent receptor [Steroidobacteraceae bacterium]|jgi:iron complex outermembrane receptor protein